MHNRARNQWKGVFCYEKCSENETEYQTDIYRQINVFPSYHSNSWRRQQVSGGHHSEVSNVDHHIADRHQGDPNDDGQRQVPG